VLISPIHPIADVLRGAKIEWGEGHPYDLEVPYRSHPIVEAECHDHMEVRVQIQGSLIELPKSQY
jgi:hypothetical protein